MEIWAIFHRSHINSDVSGALESHMATVLDGTGPQGWFKVVWVATQLANLYRSFPTSAEMSFLGEGSFD